MTLYMTELVVADWPAALAWYRDILGLPVEMVDEARQFALLGGGGGRLALKGGAVEATAGRHRLVFLVEDLESVRDRLGGSGVPAGEIAEDPVEPYRSLKAEDPEGTPITLFRWTRRGSRESWQFH